MKTLIKLLSGIVTELAPPALTAPISELAGFRRISPRAIETLANARFEPTAHLLTALLRDAKPPDAAQLREGVRRILPSLLDTPFDADGLNLATRDWLLSHHMPWVRRRILEYLGQRGNRDDLDIIQLRFRDTEWTVRVAAHHATLAIAPLRLQEILAEQIRDPRIEVRKFAWVKLHRARLPFDPVEFALEHIRTLKEDGAVELLAWVLEKSKPRRTDAIVAGTQSPNAKARLLAVRTAEKEKDIDIAALLDPLIDDPDPGVRENTRQTFRKRLPHRGRDLDIRALQDPSPCVRLDALKSLRHDNDPLLVQAFLPLCRDSSPEHRALALEVTAKFDDPRVLSELVSSLNDVAPHVSARAKDILAGKHGPVPVLQRFPTVPGDEPLWVRLRAQADRVNDWAEAIGVELLGRRVSIQNYRQGLGRTQYRRKDEAISIEVSDTPVTSLHPQGEQIMRALVLHELGHHVCDFGEPEFARIDRLARKEGLAVLMNVLEDERLERTLRSRRPEWGVLFDRLGAYAFARNENEVALRAYADLLNRPLSEVREAVRCGDLPGRLVSRAGHDEPRVILRDSDVLRIPGLLPPFVAFLASFRCGFDAGIHPDPRVTQALGLIPRNLKDVSHRQLLDLARQLAELIGGDTESKQQMAELMKRIRAHPGVLTGLGDGLGRLIECDQLPGAIRTEATGIRRSPPRRTRDERFRPSVGVPGGREINEGTARAFNRLLRDERWTPDLQRHAVIVSQIRPYIRPLRQYLEQLGRGTREEYAMRRGRRLDVAAVRRTAFRPDVNILVHADEIHAPNAYIGLLIDRSGSMAQDGKIELARRFGVLLAEAAKGIPGLAGHVNAFDHATFYDLGGFSHNAIARLEPGGGNNDAGGLQRAAELALASGKQRRLVILASDGSPTECTVTALRGLVENLHRRHGVRCVQIALAPLEHATFPHYVDVSALPMAQAVKLFARMLIRITADWR